MKNTTNTEFIFRPDGYTDIKELPTNSVIWVAGIQDMLVCIHDWKRNEFVNKKVKMTGWSCSKCGTYAPETYK